MNDDDGSMSDSAAIPPVRPRTGSTADEAGARDELIASLSSLTLPLMWTLRQRARHVYEPFGVQPTRVLLMELVDRGTDQPKAIAEMLEAVPPAVTAMVNELIEKGWLARQSDPTDRRRARLRLTPAGHTALAQMRAAWLAASNAQLNRFETEQLRSMLHVIGELLEGRP